MRPSGPVPTISSSFTWKSNRYVKSDKVLWWKHGGPTEEVSNKPVPMTRWSTKSLWIPGINPPNLVQNQSHGQREKTRRQRETTKNGYDGSLLDFSVLCSFFCFVICFAYAFFICKYLKHMKTKKSLMALKVLNFIGRKWREKGTSCCFARRRTAGAARTFPSSCASSFALSFASPFDSPAPFSWKYLCYNQMAAYTMEMVCVMRFTGRHSIYTQNTRKFAWR